jgi:hypothetical protein
MTAAIKYLEDLNISTATVNRAVQDAALLDLDPAGYREVMKDLTGADSIPATDDEVKFAFRYLVADIVVGQPVDIALASALPKATKFIAARPWVLAKPDYTTEPSGTDALGQPKRKKGAKKDAALAFWKANQSKYSSRKDWIEALADNIGLTKAAASTYHHNLKKGLW